jgi:SNF2 family DNA or RNA helicase
LYLKTKKETSKKFYPTRTQSDYIINYFDTVPKVARKWVDLDTYFAKKFAEERYLMETPEKIYIEKLLVEKEKSYHIWGKFFEKDPLTEFWVPKSSLIKTHNVEKVEVDYSKYDHRPPLEHQKEAVEKLAGSRRFILADDMGLGKTTATIIAALETGSKKILIICPASLTGNVKLKIIQIDLFILQKVRNFQLNLILLSLIMIS